MGKRGVGTLLVVGSEGDLGCHHLALLSWLYPPHALWTGASEVGKLGVDHCLLPLADVLVGHQLFAFSTEWSQHPHLFPAVDLPDCSPWCCKGER